MTKKQPEPEPEDYDNEISIGDKDPYKVVENLTKEKNIEYMTDLTSKEIRAISIILFLSDYLDIPEFEKFIKNVLKLKVSKNRKGRKEFISMFGKLKEINDRKEQIEQRMFT